MSRALACLLGLLPSIAVAAGTAHRGVSLGLFAEDAGWSYAPLLDEIEALGATDVELVVPLYQADVAATAVGYHPRFSPPLDRVRATVREAVARKLRVTVFPIVRLVAAGPDEWRGTLRPRDRDAWTRSYGARLEELAAIAEQEHATALSIGSELSTLDGDHRLWQALVERVRARYRGLLLYSANWDHFEAVGIWDLVDRIGVCAYFPLAGVRDRPSLTSLTAAWASPRERLAALAARAGHAVWLTELGYRSQPNALREPWDEAGTTPADAAAHEQQRLGFAAFRTAFTPPPPWLDGFFVWNWYGWGGAASRGYTPRGKPAEREVRALFR